LYGDKDFACSFSINEALKIKILMTLIQNLMYFYYFFSHRKEIVNNEYKLLFYLTPEETINDTDAIYQNCSSQIMSSTQMIYSDLLTFVGLKNSKVTRLSMALQIARYV